MKATFSYNLACVYSRLEAALTLKPESYRGIHQRALSNDMSNLSRRLGGDSKRKLARGLLSERSVDKEL